jgi:hypothetical protein
MVDAGGQQAPEKTIGPYELFQQLGTGQFGNAYLAQHGASKETFLCVKIFKNLEIATLKTVEKEIMAAAVAPHINVIGIKDAG